MAGFLWSELYHVIVNVSHVSVRVLLFPCVYSKEVVSWLERLIVNLAFFRFPSWLLYPCSPHLARESSETKA